MTRARTGPALLLAAVLSALSWVAWMGWDDEYQVDPATGLESGPYETWQVVGSGACFVAVVVWTALVTRAGGRVPLATAGGYTAAYAVTVVPTDESGLALVGVLMVAVGTWLAAQVLVLLVETVVRLRGSRAGSP